jgi:3-isopropylmalate/(R)-2-methylmalate dehydratase small subunit
MPCVTASREDLKTLRALVENDPDTEVEIDLESMTIRAGDKSFPCSLRDSARQALTEGRWDPIADLLENLPKVESTAANLAYMQ